MSGERRKVPLPGPIEAGAFRIATWLMDFVRRSAAQRWARGTELPPSAPSADRPGAVEFTLVDGTKTHVVPDDVVMVEHVSGGSFLIVAGRGSVLVMESVAEVGRRLTQTGERRGAVVPMRPVYAVNGPRGDIRVVGRELEPAPACPTCDRRMRSLGDRWICCGGEVGFVHEGSGRLTRSAPPVRRRLVDDALRCASCKAYIRLADRSCPFCRRVFDPNAGIELGDEVRS